MFVTASNFEVPPMNLPGLDHVPNSFTDFVTEQEEEHLSKLFGVRFWTAFKAGIAALPSAWAVATAYIIGNTVTHANKEWTALQDSTGVVPGTDPLTWEDAENKWLALREGANYTTEDVEYVWAGMAKLVTQLIYSQWLRHVVADQVSVVGVVKGKSENADAGSVNIRMCRAWNKYSDLAYGPKLLRGFASVANTLFGYLSENASAFDSDVAPEYDSFDDYLSDQFTSPGHMNIFDL